MSSWADSIGSDVRFGFRLLRKSPVFSAIAIATLALGIGANTAMFSVLDSVVLRPLPFSASDRLAALWESQQDQSRIFISYRDLTAFQREARSFDSIAGETWVFGQRTLGGHGAPRMVLAIHATGNLFQMLGMPAQRGRTFTPADGDSCLLVLSHSGWRDDFASDPNIVGSAVTLDHRPCTVLGVMPPQFSVYPREATLWVVPANDDPLVAKPNQHVWAALGRLKPGVSAACKNTGGLSTWMASISAFVMETRLIPPSS